MNIPRMSPRLFRETYEWTAAIFDGYAPVDKHELKRIGDRLSELYGHDPGDYEKTLVTVAMDRFHGEAMRYYLIRADGLNLLLRDDELTQAWAEYGWARGPTTDLNRFAPAKFVVEAAAVCPLRVGPLGVPPRFDLSEFHMAAYQRAAARGVDFDSALSSPTPGSSRN
jgi:hypothetical protein